MDLIIRSGHEETIAYAELHVQRDDSGNGGHHLNANTVGGIHFRPARLG